MAPRVWLIPVQPRPEHLSLMTEVLQTHLLEHVLVPADVVLEQARRPPHFAVLLGGSISAELLESLRALMGLRVPTVVLVSYLTDRLESLLLDRGARDVLALPTSPERIGSRLEVIARASGLGRRESRLPSRIRVPGGIEVHPARRVVLVDGRDVELSKTEFDLLLLICRRPGEVASRAELTRVTGPSPLTARALESHISRLRAKLVRAGARGGVQAVRGVGYRWTGGGSLNAHETRPDSAAVRGARVYPGVAALDRLDLYRRGVIPWELVDLDLVDGCVVDAGCVPVVDIGSSRPTLWHQRRPRPFEEFYLAPGSYGAPVAVVDSRARLPLVPADTATVVALASTDGGGSTVDLSFVRRARRRAHELGAEFVVAPLGSQAPHRGTLLRFVKKAYGQPAPVHDLTSASLPHAVGRGVAILALGPSRAGTSSIVNEVHRRLLEESAVPAVVLVPEIVGAFLQPIADGADLGGGRMIWLVSELARSGAVILASAVAPVGQSYAPLRELAHDRGCMLFVVEVGGVARGARPSRASAWGDEADLRVDGAPGGVSDQGAQVLEALRSRGWTSGEAGEITQDGPPHDVTSRSARGPVNSS